ncbi:MAG: 4Fe-4S ferredoxin [Thiotrichales bacterium SG8_50]|jgi:thioredoxin reductase (NADPH)|nr:MAG: 4Fe-4S ferredoxin [Thiotrichales bacterium SG8_50]KPL28121.1 MAG: 4Fe-4S ferredoxin [Acidithiobacillales bacterium SM1_46]
MNLLRSDLFLIALYLVPLVAVMIWYVRRHRRHEAKNVATWQGAVESGLTEPASLHPVIDPKRCLGSKACVSACPEQAIGIIGGKARLVDPAKCIGHGACKAACPHDAIALVFGTAKRGMDIPQVDGHFETNVRGIFIAGELGGMGLIRKAVEQGRQAIERIAKRRDGAFPYDVVIVGAGPAGLAASLGALEKKLRFVTVEQEDAFGGTVYHYPRNKIVMTAPVQLPIIGKVRMGEISKEKLLEFWQGVLSKTGLKVNFSERMEAIRPDGKGFVVRTAKQEYRTRCVLLAIGRRGTPRKLDVPGEEQSKVVYRLIDPEQYRGQHVLVVGGGDSALEAALAVAEESGAKVTVSYRGDAFGRVKQKNRERLQAAEAGKRVAVLLNSNVKRIDADRVVVDQQGKNLTLKNDAVIVSAGGVLPTPFLKEIGILVETKHGEA